MKNPYQVIKDFEEAVANYCGSPYCVAVDSCTNALFLCLASLCNRTNILNTVREAKFYVTIPKKTYLSVPQQIMLSGFGVRFEDIKWSGIYQLKPFFIWDSARRFTHNMYKDLLYIQETELIGQGVKEASDILKRNPVMMCTSHHWTKPLGIERGGCILHNDPEADTWLRRARFHGRTAGVHPRDDNPIMGWNMMMLPSVAANGLVRLSHLPKNNPDLPNDDYPDLSQMVIFK